MTKFYNADIYRYDGLSIKDMLTFLDEKHPQVFDYLPEPEMELPKTPKQWIANVCSTVLKGIFAGWVEAQIKNRHARVAKDKDLMIQMDP